ncbi:MAG: ERCC4 domain-containing protein [Planctomycetota bacterium]
MRTIRITVDDRERSSGLALEVARLWSPTETARLAVGDVHVGPWVIVERKTITDFAASVRDTRLFNQAKALVTATKRPLLVIEGEDPVDVMTFHPNALRGVFLALLVGYRLPLLRTYSTTETASFLAHLAAQEQRRLERLLQQGKTEATPQERTAAEMLAVVPGIGSVKARCLLDRFGSIVATLAASEAELLSVPGIGEETVRAIAELREPEGPPR